jgi:tetraacyldisaccharide 4'-kinase
VVHPDRVAAARKVVELGANLVIADDGLQHYRLARDIEIVVVDGTRGFGNGRLLPAGPLREPVGRLAAVDRVLVQRPPSAPPGPDLGLGDEPLGFHLDVSGVCSLDGSQTRHIADFAGRTVHAVAGIGHPERFFGMLESFGLEVLRHPLPDHAPVRTSDLTFDDGNAVFMTEKDAVKCRTLNVGDCWYVPVDVEFEDEGAESLLKTILAKLQASPGGAS